MNIVEEYWEVDGQSLHTWASAIQTLTGRDGIPPRRGENQVVAYHPGQIWRPKVLDARTLSLAMWVNNADEEGAGSSRAQFNENLDALKRLFAVTARELALVRRRLTNSGLLVQNGSGECVGALEPNMFARDGAHLVVDLLMADPFWYGAESQTTVPVAGGNVTNAGDIDATKMVIRFTGPLTNPQLVNQSLDTAVSVSYNGTIAGGAWIELDTEDYTARTNAGVSVLGQISHSGSRHWMVLEPGVNAMLLNVVSGSGSARVTFEPPYL